MSRGDVGNKQVPGDHLSSGIRATGVVWTCAVVGLILLAVSVLVTFEDRLMINVDTGQRHVERYLLNWNVAVQPLDIGFVPMRSDLGRGAEADEQVHVASRQAWTLRWKYQAAFPADNLESLHRSVDLWCDVEGVSYASRKRYHYAIGDAARATGNNIRLVIDDEDQFVIVSVVGKQKEKY